MSFSTVGYCSKCGAPIYAPSMWMGVTPPPSSHSCSCFAQVTITARLGSSTSIPGPIRAPIKWPTRIQAQEEAEECFDSVDSIEGFLSGYDWLKSFVEKGE